MGRKRLGTSYVGRSHAACTHGPDAADTQHEGASLEDRTPPRGCEREADHEGSTHEEKDREVTTHSLADQPTDREAMDHDTAAAVLRSRYDRTADLAAAIGISPEAMRRLIDGQWIGRDNLAAVMRYLHGSPLPPPPRPTTPDADGITITD